MSASQSEQMITRYLDRVAGHLRDLSAEERSEILSDLRAHIDEAIGDPATASEAHVRNVLERLGDPNDLARESRDRLSDTASPGYPTVYTRINKSPGALEVVAIVLTALMWPVGVILAWLSQRWLVRDKIVATIIPVFSFILLLVALVPAGFGAGATEVFMTEPRVVQVPSQSVPTLSEPGGPTIVGGTATLWSVLARLVAVATFLIGTVGGPFIAAIYLAIRLQPVDERFYPDGTRFSSGFPAMATWR